VQNETIVGCKIIEFQFESKRQQYLFLESYWIIDYDIVNINKYTQLFVLKYDCLVVFQAETHGLDLYKEQTACMF